MSTTLVRQMSCGCEFLEEWNCEGDLRPRLDACPRHSDVLFAERRQLEADRDRLEGELAEERRLHIVRLADKATLQDQLEDVEVERDEARAVARGLLRLARAQYGLRSVLDWQKQHRIDGALAALEPGVRKLVEE